MLDFKLKQELILKKLKSLENKKNTFFTKYLNKVYNELPKFVCSFICSIWGIVYVIRNTKNDFSYFILLIIFMLFLYQIKVIYNMFENYFITRNSWKLFVKTELIPFLTAGFGDIKWSNYTSNTFWELIKRSRLFPYIKNSDLFLSSDDFFIGNYNGVNFSILEIKKRYFFSGIILAFDFNKKNNGITVLEPKNDASNRNNIAICHIIFGLILLICALGALIIIISGEYSSLLEFWSFVSIYSLSVGIIFIVLGVKNYREIDNLTTEDNELTKFFNVYSDDQVEGRYLLTPSFIERYKNLKTELKAGKMKCSLIDNKIIFAISTKKNFFEFWNIFKPLNDYKYVNQFYSQIKSIYDIIDYFKLNEKTGL